MSWCATAEAVPLVGCAVGCRKIEDRSRSRGISATSCYQVVRPVARKHSSSGVRFIRSPNPVVRDERTPGGTVSDAF